MDKEHTLSTSWYKAFRSLHVERDKVLIKTLKSNSSKRESQQNLIVRDQFGSIDYHHYTVQAGRLRGEALRSFFHLLKNFFKKLVIQLNEG